MTYLELLIDGRIEAGDDPVVIRKELEALAKMDPTLLTEIPNKDVGPLKSSLRTIMAFISNATNEERLGFLKEVGISPKTMARSMNSHATFELAEIGKKSPPPAAGVSARDALVRLGFACWPYSFKVARDGDDIVGATIALIAYVNQVVLSEDPERARLWNLVLSTEEGQFMQILAARWAHYGFPVVQLAGHKYAAALMSTSVGHGIEVNPPWETFVIELPSGMLRTDDERGVSRELSCVLVSRYKSCVPGENGELRWWFQAYTSDMRINLHRFHECLEDMLEEDIDQTTDPAFPNAMEVDLTGSDERTLFLLSRLVLSTCLAMSNPEDVRPVGKCSKGEPLGPPRGVKEPACRVYRVGHPIELDCRPAVNAFLNGTKRDPLAIQFMVRGFFRQQPYGPRSSLRRSQWIRPFWKGPSDAPINVRPIVVGKKDK